MNHNPLLNSRGLPAFSKIRPEHAEPALTAALNEARTELARLAEASEVTFDWAVALETIKDRIHRTFAPVSHLNSVVNSPELREAYNACLPLATAFYTDLGQNQALYERYLALAEQPEVKADPVKASLVEHALRDFQLAGVALDGPVQAEFKQVMQDLAGVQARFEQNLMDATDAFRHHETRPSRVAGIPQVVLNRAAARARDEGLSGWLFTLDPPTYMDIMAHADEAALREIFYRAWVTRASDQASPDGARWDNAPLMDEILRLRYRAARLLGFENFAQLSLATKMAGSVEEVMGFLGELADTSRSVAGAEISELEAFAGQPLNAWDTSYYSEKLKQQRFDLSEDALRVYFPLPTVFAGLFKVSERLFGIRIQPRNDLDTWHEDVRYYQVNNRHGVEIGGFFVDLYARPNKRGGAWMDECLVRFKTAQGLNNPVAYLVCNVNPPTSEHPSLLTHSDVVTLFHEFGHTLHHLLTEVDYPSVSGINGVPWDAVELPSQFLENYAWLEEVVPWISAHYETGEPLPLAQLERLKASRTFHGGLKMVRQLEFALFDFQLHAEYTPDQVDQTARVLEAVRKRVAVVKTPDYNRFANGFSHIFGGGYAAGYYSYKWAEVLAADAFAAFQEAGSFDSATAQRFLDAILSRGGSRDIHDAFVEFRGREPSLEPLLAQAGILTGAAA
jgi:oligopeptidase A